MYEAHFGLRELPFGITPDTSFAFSCTAHQEALNTLLVAAASGEGFTKVTGEVGTGKTLLCRRFLDVLERDSYVCAYLPNPLLDPKGLMHALAHEFRLRTPENADQQQLVQHLNQSLLRFAKQGKRALVCLDEAQALPLQTLEALRLLSNLETAKHKLLQVILFGQPELDVMLAQDNLRQLRQRITFEHRLTGLTKPELLLYLAHRLRVAGYTGRPLFTRGAVNSLYSASEGVPRLVNILAHKALLLVYGEGGREVQARHLRGAIKDTSSAHRIRFPWFRPRARRPA
jgi:MSHA biogenesis protein MshM